MSRRQSPSAAFSTIGQKTSTGRNTHTAVKVAEVQTLPCPNGGLHVLTNDARARTYCKGCGVGWAELDQEARGA